MILTSRERNDLEVLHRICKINRILFDEGTFFAKQLVGDGSYSFITINPEDFPSLKKQSYSVEELLKGE